MARAEFKQARYDMRIAQYCREIGTGLSQLEVDSCAALLGQQLQDMADTSFDRQLTHACTMCANRGRSSSACLGLEQAGVIPKFRNNPLVIAAILHDFGTRLQDTALSCADNSTASCEASS